MTKRMLIDSTHAEETRVVMLDGNRLEDFDVETSTKQQLKGNIYLAKVVRVEPSLQAAFVEYGGGRHGFLAFGEIHPDYYQIPVADRQRLLEMQEAEAREDEDAEDRAAARDARDAQVKGSDTALVAAPDAALVAASAAAADFVEMADQAGAPDVMDAITEASYAVQADPETAEAALPRPDQVAQAAAISQDILIAPHEAETMFPDAAASEAASADIPAVETPVAEPPVATNAEVAEAPNSEPAAAAIEAAAAIPSADPLEEPGADMAPEAADLEARVVNAAAQEPPSPEALASELTAFDGPGIDGIATEAAAANEHLDEAVADRPVENGFPGGNGFEDAEPPPESVGGEVEEPREQRAPPRFSRNYKIQEVIRRRQILLIQVVKEERGTKGAALTTYISLAGRFSVLMPNSPRGGGISRKITSAADRRRLKEVTAELDLPRGMGLIVRTAGANRPKPEIIRDCEYLLNQWDQIRDLTMKSVAPALIYEEANLIKRAIRDVYSRDVDDILVDGEQGWRAARDFMRMLMPTHARKVQLWKDPQPLFVKAQVEAQLDAMLSPTVQLRSGGYLVINQTEALVAIDVNSGRSTRERGIEETALKTNMEAAEEAARQLRLRDLAGLIVIDFIDMESRRNIAAVEKRLKDALKIDRARIQVGSISHFGLMEMSRQRLRPSLAETSLVVCTHCAGTGQVRSTESAALHVLRAVEEEGAKRRAAEIVVHVAGSIALYVLNHKRVRLAEIENRYAMRVAFAADDTLLPPNTRIDRVRAQAASELPAPISQLAPPEPFEDPDEEAMEQAGEQAADQSEEPVEALGDEADDASRSDDDAPRPGETAEEEEQRSRRRRRRRRGGRREDSVAGSAVPAVEAGQEAIGPAVFDAETVPAMDGNGATEAGDAVIEALRTEPTEDDAPAAAVEDGASEATAEVAVADVTAEETASETLEATGDDADRSKRRGRRGGRRRRREPGDIAAEPADAPQAEAGDAPAYSPPAYVPPPYVGPTPADPFGGSSAFDIFDAIEQAEQERALAAIAPRRRTPELEAAEPPVMKTQVERTVQDMPPEPEPVIAEPIALEPETVSLADPEPVVEAVKHPAENQSVENPVEPGAEPTPEPVAGPLIVPTLINGADTLTEKKRGWWRR